MISVSGKGRFSVCRPERTAHGARCGPLLTERDRVYPVTVPFSLLSRAKINQPPDFVGSLLVTEMSSSPTRVSHPPLTAAKKPDFSGRRPPVVNASASNTPGCNPRRPPNQAELSTVTGASALESAGVTPFAVDALDDVPRSVREVRDTDMSCAELRVRRVAV